MSKAGRFEITVWRGGHPVWCELYHEAAPGEKVKLRQFTHTELHDLIHAAKMALSEAHQQLTPEQLAKEPKL